MQLYEAGLPQILSVSCVQRSHAIALFHLVLWFEYEMPPMG
jgi:hypothetical protein